MMGPIGKGVLPLSSRMACGARVSLNANQDGAQLSSGVVSHCVQEWSITDLRDGMSQRMAGWSLIELQHGI